MTMISKSGYFLHDDTSNGKNLYTKMPFYAIRNWLSNDLLRD